MNSDIDLTASRVVGLLHDLKTHSAAAAEAEQQLQGELRTRRFKVDRRAQQAVKLIEERVEVRLQEVADFADALEKQVGQTHDDRVARIKRFQNSGTRNLAHMAQQAREKFLGVVQMKRVHVERKHAADVAVIKRTFETESEDLAAQDANLLRVERAARSFFAGYSRFLALLPKPKEAGSAPAPEHSQAVEALAEHIREAKSDLDAFRQVALPRLFSVMPLSMIVVVAVVATIALGFMFGGGAPGFTKAAAVGGGLILLAGALYLTGAAQGGALARAVGEHLRAGRHLHTASLAASEARRDAASKTEGDAFDKVSTELKAQWEGADKIQKDFEQRAKDKLTTQVPRLAEKNIALLQSKLRYVDTLRKIRSEEINRDAQTQKDKIAQSRDADMAVISDFETRRFAGIEAAWRGTIYPLYAQLAAINAAPPASFPPWSDGYVQTWTPPATFSTATRFAEIFLTLTSLPEDPRLALPGPAQVFAPLMLAYPQLGSLLIETREASDHTVSDVLNNVMLRLLCTTPPGKVAFTILDPVGLGQNFAGVMHLGDYEETLINRRIWTQRDQIEERLQELNDHIEKVIQMYLRNEYETITQYNQQAGTTAEKYHFLVVADFPHGFSDVAARRLQSIAISGPRCGVFTLIHWDRRAVNPDGFVPDELRKSSICLRREGDRYVLDRAPEDAVMTADAAPTDELAVPLLHRIGKASIDSNRVQVPFTQIAPRPEEMWTGDTTQELRVAIGRTGATKHQYLSIGKGTRQHALFAGKTGSGKSTLFHVIITNLALTCSPDQVEFYLIDFKKGVEFKCYATARLPHARVVAIESDREFGLSVLQRVDEELKRRGDMFRRLGVQDIAGYKRAGGTEPVPRSLLLIDEFQEFFVEDDTIAQTASVLFDRIVRQGRAFGIHVLLGSQTLGGAFTLARATMGQMVIRVALQCNEADAYLIMDENNAAPRLLTRPGEGIYNDSAGAIEGNSPFQVCWLGDEERDQWLHKVREMADLRHDKHAGPIVFEGNAPAEVRENYLLSKELAARSVEVPRAGRMWLGAPNSIKGPTEAVFQRQSGNHLLVVGQREEVTLTMLAIGLVSLAAQYPAGKVKLAFIHNSPPDSPDMRFLNRLFESIPHGVRVAQGHDLADLMTGLADELKSRTSGEAAEAPATFIFIHGLQKFKKLKADDDLDFSFSSGDSGPSPASQLSSLITEGSTQGMHLIVSVDTYNNVMRFLSRKLLTEFEMRLVFQMSANDSASLIDSPKAANLGLHRALLHNEQAGTLETFRPYAEPDSEWLDEVKAALGK